MTSTIIKKNISKALENIDDTKFLQAVYDIISSKSNQVVYYEFSEEQKLVLEDREKAYKHGKGKSYNWEETKSMIRKKKNAL